MTETSFDLVVLGAGPGGYVAAIRAAQLGMNVACIDENQQLGGTCLRVGCIPSKALLESSHLFSQARKDFAAHGIKVSKVSIDLAAMLKRKDEIVSALTGGIGMLFKRAKITSINGRGKILEPGKLVVTSKTGEQTVSANKILIATGSVSASLPGIEMDGDLIGDSTTALSYPAVPEKLVVIGGGYIGMEMGSVWNRLGSEVIVLEALDRLFAGMDLEISRLGQRAFEKQGIELRLKSWVESVKKSQGKVIVQCKEAEPLEVDRVLVATGRRANTTNIGLDAIGIETDKIGRIAVDENYMTAVDGVFAVGDCIAGPMLAHKASEEGVCCVERMAGVSGHVNYDAIPAVVYTHPEIASVGKTEEELKEAGVEYRKGMCPYGASGRARAIGDTEGRVKMLADAKTDRILGVHIIGSHAGDLIAEAVAAIDFGATSEDIARVCHAHPTLSEVLHEAALAVDRRAIHT
jgi:dihydrolipoamide dehydrogenase